MLALSSAEAAGSDVGTVAVGSGAVVDAGVVVDGAPSATVTEAVVVPLGSVEVTSIAQTPGLGTSIVAE